MTGSLLIRPLLAAVAMVIAAVGPTRAAVTIDFSTFPANSTLSASGDISFSLIGGQSSTGLPTLSAVGGLTNTNDYGGYPTATILDFAFHTPVDDVSFVFDNEGTSYGGRGDSFYDAFVGSRVVSSGSLNGAARTSFTVAGSGITELQFNNGTAGLDSWWFQVNSITYTAESLLVPEPASATLLFMGAAIASLCAAIGRRHSAPG